jgi:hypothetical protein
MARLPWEPVTLGKTKGTVEVDRNLGTSPHHPPLSTFQKEKEAKAGTKDR